MSSIPVVDLAAEASQVVSDLMAAYEQVGFAYVVGHGVPTGLIDAAFAASRELHQLPVDVKASLALDSRNRGFIAIDTATDRTSTIANVTKPNQSESWMVMREDASDSADVLAGTYLAGPNQWPPLDGFRDVVEAYQHALGEVGWHVMQLFGDALDASEVFTRAFATPTTWLRLLWYPPIVESAPDDLYGSAPHCDFGCITLLAQDEVGGLQVRGPDGAWIDVPPRDGALVMNVGDMLHQWSNGRLRSTPHRVINRGGRQRYSLPYFYDPHMSTTIEPLGSCVDDDHPARFEPVLFEDVVRRQLTHLFDRHRTV